MEIIGSKIKLERGIGVVESIYLTELNLIMVRVRFDGFWINYRLSELPDIKKILIETNY